MIDSKREVYLYVIGASSGRVSLKVLVFRSFIASQIWHICSLFLNLFGIIRVMPMEVKNMLSCWLGQSICSILKTLWKAIPLCILCNVWLERNKRCFEGKKDHISYVDVVVYKIYAFGVRAVKLRI